MKVGMTAGAAVWLAVVSSTMGQTTELEIHTYAGLTITGAVGTVYSIEAKASAGPADDWAAVEFFQLTETNTVWMDRKPAAGSRFYRARLIPPPPGMVFISPGTFRFGSPTNEVGHDPFEGPQSWTIHPRGFFIGRTEVTRAEFQAAFPSNPTPSSLGSSSDGDLPVVNVTWRKAWDYCYALTRAGWNRGTIPRNAFYRLPTEAEWEYACRAGTSTRFSFGDDEALLDDYAWHIGNSDKVVQPVGRKKPNAWGLYDMHGNAAEWCQDQFWLYPDTKILVDPYSFNERATSFAVRGGSVGDLKRHLRCARRGFTAAVTAGPTLGFRVVLAPQ